MRKISRAVVVVVTATALCIGGAVAWAAWTSHGSGTARANARTSNRLVVVVAAGLSSDTPLYPGVDGDLVVQLQNTNPFNVTAISVSRLAAAITADPAHALLGCTGAATGVSVDDFFDVNWRVPAGQTVTFHAPAIVTTTSPL